MGIMEIRADIPAALSEYGLELVVGRIVTTFCLIFRCILFLILFVYYCVVRRSEIFFSVWQHQKRSVRFSIEIEGRLFYKVCQPFCWLISPILPN